MTAKKETKQKTHPLISINIIIIIIISFPVILNISSEPEVEMIPKEIAFKI